MRRRLFLLAAACMLATAKASARPYGDSPDVQGFDPARDHERDTGRGQRERPQAIRGAFGGRKTRWRGLTQQSWLDSRNAPEAGRVGPVGR